MQASSGPSGATERARLRPRPPLVRAARGMPEQVELVRGTRRFRYRSRSLTPSSSDLARGLAPCPRSGPRSCQPLLRLLDPVAPELGKASRPTETHSIRPNIALGR